MNVQQLRIVRAVLDLLDRIEHAPPHEEHDASFERGLVIGLIAALGVSDEHEQRALSRSYRDGWAMIDAMLGKQAADAMIQDIDDYLDEQRP